MTTSRMRSIGAVAVALCALAGISPAIAEVSGDQPASNLPEVVRGSAVHAKPAPQAAPQPCKPTPEAQAARTVGGGLGGTYTGTRYVTGPMSTEGTAVFTALSQTYGCQR